MAKDGKMDLPRVDSIPPGATVRLKDGESIQPLDPPSADFANMKKKADRKIMESHGVPASVTEGYVPRRVDVKMTRAQAVILRDKLRLLQDSGATTVDGRFITSRTQAIQWILENEVVI